jgi:diguanylate cyclase (GGDEF)-like protein
VTVTDDGRGDPDLITFQPDLAAPMVHREELLGVIAIRAPRLRQTRGKEVMRLIGQMGGFTLHSLATYMSMKSAVDVDPLTGLFNKRVLNRRLEDMVLEARSSGSPFGIFLFDIDHFKNYNDANGHVAGDRLLQMLSRVARDNARTDDILGRFGGEEFLLIVPGAGQREIASTAHHLRRAIEAFDFPFGNLQPLGRLTVSGGAACFPEDGKDATALLREADAALYRAKRAGRNQVATAAAGVVSNGAD